MNGASSTTTTLLGTNNGNLATQTAVLKATDAAGHVNNTSSTSFVLSTLAPMAPILALGSGVAGGATASEAAQASGVVTVTGASGPTIAVNSDNGTHTITKTVTGTGTAQAVTLSSADVFALGDGIITVSATATDLAGNVSSAGSASFELDTLASETPALALGAGGAGGATAAEATQAGGVVRVSAEMGATVALSFANGAHMVTKTVMGTGEAQAVTLTSMDVATLTNGTIAVSATATDAAGNVSSAGSPISCSTRCRRPRPYSRWATAWPTARALPKRLKLLA